MLDLFIKETKSILDILRREVPLQIEMSALLVASIPDDNEKRSNQEKAIAHFEKKLKDNPDDLQSQATLERLKKELETGTFTTASGNDEISYDKDSLRKRLHVIFGAYLAFLEEKDTEAFTQATEIIEKGISDSERILAKVEKRMKRSNSKSEQNVDDEKAIARRASEFFAPVDKVTKSIFDTRKNHFFYDNPEVLIEVGKKGGKPVRNIVSINIDKLKSVTLSNDVMLNPYNRALHNIAVSLYAAGNTHFTPRMIYETMNGNSRLHKPPEQVYKAIMDGMRKLMYTAITIDATEEAKAFGLDKLKFEGYLMPVKLVTAQINGQVVECFKFLDEPPLYTYARKKKQISRCDINILAVDLNMTPENITIRDYLLEQIITFKNKKSKLLNVIRYDTLYEYLDITAPNENALRQAKSDIRSKVRTILNTWTRVGFINGYEEQGERNAIAKVQILIA